MNTDVSIIIATRNRADQLGQTIASLWQTRLPPHAAVELILVDNGSSDETDAVMAEAAARLGKWARVLHLRQPRPGKARALNAALRKAQGSVLLFTDDDVRVPTEWIDPMTSAIIADDLDAIAGGIRLADDLVRPWMRDAHFDYLACTSHKKSRQEHPTVGANCAIARRVYDRIPQYDPEVGPGAIGHAEDLFFWLQMRAAGLRLSVRFDIEVEHHPSADRLTREAFLRMAKKNGDWEAYVDYHWAHTPRRAPRLAVLRSWARLWAARSLHPLEWWTHPAAPAWELPLLAELEFRQRYINVRKAPRNYRREGCFKVAGEVS